MPFDQNDWAPATASAADLAEVKTTAKNKVKTYAQDSAPTAEAVGDLWMDTDNGDALYRWDGKDWVNVQDGSIAEAKKAADEAMQTAKDAATITITSTHGLVFKSNAISTTLIVTVYQPGGNRIDNQTALVAAFGSTARIEWGWQREDEDGWSTILSTDSRLSNDGFALSVSPADVDARTSFEASVVTD